MILFRGTIDEGLVVDTALASAEHYTNNYLVRERSPFKDSAGMTTSVDAMATGGETP